MVPSKAIHRLNATSRMFHGVGAGVLTAMMFFIVADVALRYFFNRPIFGGYEVTQSMMGVVVALALAYTAVEKGHIRVDVLVSRLRQRGQAIIGSFMGLLSIALVSLITWQNILYIKEAIDGWVITASLHIPIFPLFIVLTMGFALLWLVLLADFVESLAKVIRK